MCARVEFEIQQIDLLLNKYHELIESSKNTEPDLIKLTALASVIHSFYNGIENIFLLILKNASESITSNAKWHRELLVAMTHKTSFREHVISEEISIRVAGYLAFRHFYRHSYSFHLDWDELQSLVSGVDDLWKDLKAELEQFLENHSKP
jgi:hypothetical protein